MMYGIRYRGRHSDEFGVICKTKKRPAIAPVRITEETVPYRDGSLDFSTQGGRLFYDDKLVEIEITIPGDELRQTQKKITQVVQWLAGDFGDLIFDDMPVTVWRARPIDLSDIATELYRIGRVTVQFRCAPFNHCLHSSIGELLDSCTPLETDISLDYGVDSEIGFVANEEKSVSYTYVGDVPVRPRIVLDAATSRIELSVNAKKFVITAPKSFSAYGGIIVDCESWNCTGADGTCLTEYTSGEFFELIPGDNNIEIAAGDSGGMLRLEYYSKFYYGGDVSAEGI